MITTINFTLTSDHGWRFSYEMNNEVTKTVQDIAESYNAKMSYTVQQSTMYIPVSLKEMKEKLHQDVLGLIKKSSLNTYYVAALLDLIKAEIMN